MRKRALIRNVVLLFLCISVLGMGACKKEVTQVVDQGFSRVYTLKASGWSGNSQYYSYEVAVPEVDNILNANGAVMVYLSFDNGSTWEEVPEVVSNVAYGEYHSQGKVGVDLSPADGQSTITPPTADILAKVVLLDAQPLN